MSSAVTSIFRESDGTVVATSVETADGFVSRLIGLIGRTTFGDNEALIIRPCNNVHCFFMRIPIDVIFCDRENRILRIISAMKPWRVSPLVPRSRYVVELAAGRARALSLNEGDVLRFES